MDYQMHFTVESLHDANKAAVLKEALLGMQGVKEVRIAGVNRVSVIYDPAMVIPSRLTAKMRALGIKTQSG